MVVEELRDFEYPGHGIRPIEMGDVKVHTVWRLPQKTRLGEAVLRDVGREMTLLSLEYMELCVLVRALWFWVRIVTASLS